MSVFLVITTPDYEGFSVIEAHLSRAPADARAAAANEYSEQAPAFPEAGNDADYDRWHSEHETWCLSHPFGSERANGYVQQRYSVIEIPIGPAGVMKADWPSLDKLQKLDGDAAAHVNASRVVR